MSAPYIKIDGECIYVDVSKESTVGISSFFSFLFCDNAGFLSILIFAVKLAFAGLLWFTHFICLPKE
jgi:hypothetical protein